LLPDPLVASEDSPVDAEAFLENNQSGLSAAHPAAKAFWDHWISCVDIPARADAPFVEKCVLYAAARMLQTTYELLHPATEITQREIRLFRLCQYLLKRPKIVKTWLS
jgi:hypothetical protein